MVERLMLDMKCKSGTQHWGPGPPPSVFWQQTYIRRFYTVSYTVRAIPDPACGGSAWRHLELGHCMLTFHPQFILHVVQKEDYKGTHLLPLYIFASAGASSLRLYTCFVGVK
jgi:hypothetical protein